MIINIRGEVKITFILEVVDFWGVLFYEGRAENSEFQRVHGK